MTGIEGFDLIFDDSAGPAEFGLFGVRYAIKANYGYFTYRGKLYSSVGGGSVLIRPVTNSSAAYAVRETVQTTENLGYGTSVTKSTLQIFDKRNGLELAHRTLATGNIEDGSGWTGDHAVKFVRKVLKSTQTPGRPWGISDYPSAVAQVELSKPLTSSPYQVQVKPNGCPETIRFERGTIRGEGFEFRPSRSLKLVACDSGRVLVTSGVYASDFQYDVFSLDGKHISQGHVRLPLPTEARWADLKEVRIDGRRVKATLLVNLQSAYRSGFKSVLSSHSVVQIQAIEE